MVKRIGTLQSKLTLLITVAIILALSPVRAAGRDGVVKEMKRSLALLEPDVVIYTTEIAFKPGKDDELPDGRVIFEYVVAEDYRETIALVEAQDRTRQSAKLPTQRSDKSLKFYQEDTTHSEDEFLWYQIDIS